MPATEATPPIAMRDATRTYVLIFLSILVVMMLAGYFAVASQASQPPFP